MQTYFLGIEEVRAYSRTFADLISSNPDDFPDIWCPLGHSGEEIIRLISEFLPEYAKKRITIVPIRFDRDSCSAKFELPEDSEMLNGRSVLVIDSSVHSGSTMKACINEASRVGAQSVMSYSLVIKRGSSLIPNFFGLVVSDFDRVYYLLDQIPTQSLGKSGSLHKIVADDVHREPQSICSGLSSIDAMTWADLWYEVQAKNALVYFCSHKDRILGFISFSLKNGSALFIDAIAVDQAAQGKKLGGSLMRWAETYARISNCYSIELWAINERIKWYEGMGYEPTDQSLDLGKEKYTKMTRKLLYNIKPPLPANDVV